VIDKLQTLSGKKYEHNLLAFRVITDHLRGAVFLIADGVAPSNTDQGYFVRRLLRRAIRFADTVELVPGEFRNAAESVITTYQAHYKALGEKRTFILDTIADEEKQFRKTLDSGLKQFDKISLQINQTPKESKEEKPVDDPTPAPTKNPVISADQAFDLYTTYGFPIELTIEIAKEKGYEVDHAGFLLHMEKHRQKSRAGAEQKFKGGLADSSEKVVQLHTATHLMLAGLRQELGDHVHQAGSNITAERTRYDFTHPEKIERPVLDRIETYVNDAIKQGGEVAIEIMPKSVAQADPTIEASFWDRYPEEVKVYTMTTTDGTVVSRELCGGPHVSHLEEVKGTFKITKEESSSAGVRRIKAVLE
jgi:alanyl-tRNA synthetase